MQKLKLGRHGFLTLPPIRLGACVLMNGQIMPKLKIGSLFSGYGGLDLGVMEVLDAEVAWHCEWEDAPSAILDRNFPGVPNYRDVSKVDWSAVEPVDILSGGFPCQDVSLAGARRGLKDGTRSGLWAK